MSLNLNPRITSEERRERRKRGIRKKVSGTEERPRLSVFRSNKHMYGQLINDVTGHTLVAAGTVEKEYDETGKKGLDKAAEIGRLLAQRAKEKGIEKIVFDRNGYKYGGRVKYRQAPVSTGKLSLAPKIEMFLFSLSK